MSAFRSFIRLLVDGNKVDAATLNRVLTELDSNSKYLKDLIESALLGQAVFARCVTVEADALVGMPVYFDSVDGRYERALANTQVDADTGALTTSVSTQVWGVVYAKHNSTLADVILSGYATLDISAALGGETLEAGTYYLSGATAGGLTLQKPPVTAAVLMSDGDGHVYVNPTMHEALEQHKHYKFSLVCAPAGTHEPPTIGERHEITDADDSVEGWLPADHAVFGGRAPSEAVFGYNLSASNLRHLWPPLPVSGAYLEWNKGLDSDVGGTGVPLGEDGLAVIDNCGIWWLSDCYGDVPWPTTLDTVEGISDSSEINECPRDLEMALTLWFTKMTFQTTNTVVTSLVAAPGSQLTITCPSTNQTADTGPLLIDLDLGFVSGDDDTTGHLAIKELKTYPPREFTVDAGDETLTLVGDYTDEFSLGDTVAIRPTDPTPDCIDCTETYTIAEEPAFDDTNTTLVLSSAIDEVTTEGTVFSTTKRATPKFNRGPVVEAIKAGSANVSLASDVDEGDDGEHYGIVTISVDDNVEGKELQAQIVRLDGALESRYEDVLGLAFLDGVEASVRCQINVPTGELPDGTQLKLRFRILNRGANDVTIPDLTLSYRLIPYSATAAVLPTSDTEIELTSSVVLDTDEYVDVDSEAFDITAGDIVLFTLARAEDSDGPDIHIIRQSALYT